MYRVLLTGSRNWDNPDLIRIVLDSVRSAHPDMVLVHGDCQAGADAIGAEWAAVNRIPEEPHPAGWRRSSAGRRINWVHPLKRNEEMVDLGADVVLAFAMPCVKDGCKYTKFHPSHGTSHTMTLAEVAGIPVHPYWGVPR